MLYEGFVSVLHKRLSTVSQPQKSVLESVLLICNDCEITVHSCDGKLEHLSHMLCTQIHHDVVCRALGITSVCTVNRQVSVPELLAENRELKKQLQAIRGHLKCQSEDNTSAISDSEGISRADTQVSTHSMMTILQSHWVLVALTMQTVYLCFINAALASH